MSEIIIIRGTRYEIQNCIECGVVYTVPEAVIDQHRRHGGFHTCSNGHRQGWNANGDTEFSRLRRERDRLAQEIARAEDERREAERKAASAVNALARHKKRAAAGMCPCCKRTFANMARHMASQHPNFVERSNVVSIKEKSA